MSIILEGQMLKMLPRQSGTGKNGPWSKQDFVMEIPGEFPRKVCISAWGDKADEVSGLNEGEKLKVSVNIESREYNERWYTDVRAWRIEKVNDMPRTEDVQDMLRTEDVQDIPPPEDEDLLPF